MRLHADQRSGYFVVTGHGPGWIDVNGRRHQHSFVLTPDDVDTTWGPGPGEALAATHLAALAQRTDLAGRILLLGTGHGQHFPPTPWLKPLIDLGIGVEVMDTGAACRTYNILAAEGRRVAAALIVE